MNKISWLFLGCLLLAFFPFFGWLLALNGATLTCPPPPPAPSCFSSWTEREYRCLGACGGTLQSRDRNCWWSNGRPVPIRDGKGCTIRWQGCSGPLEDGCGDWSAWSNFKTCHSAKTCQTSPPSCVCSGSCYPAPPSLALLDLDKTETNLKNVFDLQKKVKLPLILDWKDWQNWQDWDINGCSVNAYQYQIEGGGKTITEYTVLSEAQMKNCSLKSNTSYHWKIRACLDSNQGGCGLWSKSKNFTTSSAPEPLSPQDPDWSGVLTTENMPLNLTLKWCESDFRHPEYEKPLSYKLNLYLIKNQQEVCHPELRKKGECYPKLIRPERPWIHDYPLPEFPNEKYGFFTKDTSYAWEVSACKNRGGTDCSQFSQRWRFSVAGQLGKPSLYHPANDPAGNKPVGFPLGLMWDGPFGANSWIVQVGTKSPIKTPTSSALFNYGELFLDTLYSWRVQPCWDYEAKNCENIWSDTHWLRTTGRPPKFETMKPEGTNIPIPVSFEWETVPGAKSYRIKIWGDGLSLEKIVEEAKFSLNYPDLKQEKNYSWQVKTCARKNGEICGKWSPVKNFRTFKLSTPKNPSPRDKEKISTDQMPKTFSWDPVPGARYYQYLINYTERFPEEVGQCPTGEAVKKIIPGNSDLISLNCLGKYQWQVTACLDSACQEAGDPGPVWYFELAQPEERPGVGPGLVPCGRYTDNPNTPWNEREPCQIKHLFLMLKIILDFLFWRVGPIILVLLVIATALFYYLSIGIPDIIIKVKSVWKSAGLGYGIIFLAWLAVNLFLLILGFKIEIFGHWWEIKF